MSKNEFEAKQKSKKDKVRAPAEDVLEGKWKQMHGQAREWWGKLTDDDLEQAAGKAETVIGLIQEKYGYTREHAEAEYKRRVKEFEASQTETAAPVPSLVP